MREKLQKVKKKNKEVPKTTKKGSKRLIDELQKVKTFMLGSFQLKDKTKAKYTT